MVSKYNPMSKEFQNECKKLGLTGYQLIQKYIKEEKLPNPTEIDSNSIGRINRKQKIIRERSNKEYVEKIPIVKIDGIVKYKEYTFWTKTSIVNDYIFEFIKNRFPDSLILPEFNQIDWFVVDKNLPIEIKSTSSQHGTYRQGTPSHTAFENRIRQQLEQNIKNYETCWFFMDTDYLRYLQNDAGRNISMNMDWFYKFMKEEKLKTFTVTYDGKIEEMSYDDFSFIKRISSTCIFGENQDYRILLKNKARIAANIFNSIGVTTEEMRKLRKQYCDDSGAGFLKWLYKKDSDNRKYTIGSIYAALGNLDKVNDCLDCKWSSKNRTALTYMTYLGLVTVLYGNTRQVTRYYIDKYNIAQYFPGYLRNKEKWDHLKENRTELNIDQFNTMITGKLNNTLK